jgi:hypothetical protein
LSLDYGFFILAPILEECQSFEAFIYICSLSMLLDPSVHRHGPHASGSVTPAITGRKKQSEAALFAPGYGIVSYLLIYRVARNHK